MQAGKNYYHPTQKKYSPQANYDFPYAIPYLCLES